MATVWKLPDSSMFLPWALFQNHTDPARIYASETEALLSFSPCHSEVHESSTCLGLLGSRHQHGV